MLISTDIWGNYPRHRKKSSENTTGNTPWHSHKSYRRVTVFTNQMWNLKIHRFWLNTQESCALVVGINFLETEHLWFAYQILIVRLERKILFLNNESTSKNKAQELKVWSKCQHKIHFVWHSVKRSSIQKREIRTIMMKTVTSVKTYPE